jgi:uncharacterized membrane protein
MEKPSPPPIGFTASEIRYFRIHAIIVAFITAAIFVLLPKGLNALVGVLFGLIVLPAPPVVVYLRRRRQHRKDQR